MRFNVTYLLFERHWWFVYTLYLCVWCYKSGIFDECLLITMLFYTYVLHTIEETPKRNYLFIKFEHRKTKDMEYLSMRQNQYMYTQKKKTHTKIQGTLLLLLFFISKSKLSLQHGAKQKEKRLPPHCTFKSAPRNAFSGLLCQKKW